MKILPSRDDFLPLGVCAIGRGGEVLYANPAAAALAAAWKAGQCGELEQLLLGPEPPAEHVLNLGDRWLKLTITAGDVEGQAAQILWAADVTAIKQAEETLQRAVTQADAAAEVKANFLATMSHEIRTPMQSVYGLLELIGEEKPPENIMSMVNTAKNSASGLLEILDDILDFAKMDADKMELDVFEVPVRTLVRGTIEALAVKVHGKDVKLLDDIAQEVPFVVIGDPKRLRQILMNLMGNAMKFTKEGSVTVRVVREVKSITPSEGGLALRFEIVDTGIGMSRDVAARLFQPFTQADSSTSRKFGGTGLGLSICKKLVEMMGGKIGVDSEEGKGSTFWFEIPTQEVSTEATALNLPKLDGISILSVEDHPQGAKEIVRSLQSMGATVESVPTFKEGLDLVKRRPFDVGVIDQGLPDGLGLDLIREIMKVRPFMGLIMYTVRDDIGMQHSLQSLGVTYLTKPASRAGLGEAVQDAARKTSKMSIDGPKRLVIAEDTESVREVLRRQLDKMGVEADFAEDGVQALEAVRSGRYGILFTDLHMPEMDGYAVVEAIRNDEEKTGRHFPVIVLTADVQMSQRQVYMGYGFDECLLKPVTLGQFKRLLIRWGLLEEKDGAAESAVPGPVPAPPAPAGIVRPPAIDRAAVIEQMGALDEGTIEMLGMFAEMTAPLIAKIRAAWEAKDYHDLKEAAHSLKGGARSACALPLGDIAAALQEDAAAGKPGCGDLVAAIETEFDRVKTEIENLEPE